MYYIIYSRRVMLSKIFAYEHSHCDVLLLILTYTEYIGNLSILYYNNILIIYTHANRGRYNRDSCCRKGSCEVLIRNCYWFISNLIIIWPMRELCIQLYLYNLHIQGLAYLGWVVYCNSVQPLPSTQKKYAVFFSFVMILN